MSMVIHMQSPSVDYTFDEDAGNGVLKSLDGMTQTDYGAYAPGPIEIVSSSSRTKAGVTRLNLSIRVPLCSFDNSGNVIIAPFSDSVRGQNKPKFVQVSATVSIPNASGIYGSTNHDSGKPGDQISANLAATHLGVSLLFALLGKQGAMPEDYSVSEPTNSVGSFDSHNPVVRGAVGAIPVDPNSDRTLTSTEG